MCIFYLDKLQTVFNEGKIKRNGPWCAAIMNFLIKRELLISSSAKQIHNLKRRKNIRTTKRKKAYIFNEINVPQNSF